MRDGFRSLKVKTFVVLAIGILLALLTYFAIEMVSGMVIESVYLSEESREAREKDYARDLQEYVNEHALTGEDNHLFAKWAEGNRYLYLMVYKDDQLFFDSGSYEPPKDTEGEDEKVPETDVPDTETGDEDDDAIGSGITVRFPSREELVKYAEENDVHLITCADKKVLMVSMADFTEYLYYDIFNIVSVTLAVLMLFIVIMVHIHGITSRITRLAEDVSLVADGDTAHAVAKAGDDEIAELSRNVDLMRTSILENIESERAAMEANAELIKAMSHDIRTPLTVLLGYIEVMKEQTDGDSTMRDYVTASEKTALRLKKLSDDLFNYFLLFGGGAPTVSKEIYGAEMLFDQMLSEFVLLLREQGYTVVYDIEGLAPGTEIYTDPNSLLRIFENLFSNIFKYADKAHPVSIIIEGDSNKIQLNFTNAIMREPSDAETSGIGLRTCYKIAEILDLDFSAGATPAGYSVELVFSEQGENK